MPLFSLWAKSRPFHPLPCHLVDVGYTVEALLDSNLCAPMLPRLQAAMGAPVAVLKRWIPFLLALHDLGKCSGFFQHHGSPEITAPLREAGLYLGPSGNPFLHEHRSGLDLQEYLREVEGWGRTEARTMGGVVTLHHSRPDVDSGVKEPGEERWASLRRQLIDLVRAEFDPPTWQPRFTHHGIIGTALSGLLVLADWVASDKSLFAYGGLGQDWRSYCDGSRAAARQAVANLGFMLSSPWKEWTSTRALFPWVEELRPLQVKGEQLCKAGLPPGLLLVEAPPGEGKTELALTVVSNWIAAGAAAGCYFAAPTTATSNPIHRRFGQMLKQQAPSLVEGLQLVHATAWLVDRPFLEQVVLEELGDLLVLWDWFDSTRLSLLAPFGVGTIDQALMAVLHIRFGFLRLFGLAGKVLVVDEVHSYSAYVSRILEFLLRWCGVLGIPVVLLSATLPAERRRGLMRAYAPGADFAQDPSPDQLPYPLMTHVTPEGKVTPHPVDGSHTSRTYRLVPHPGLLCDVKGMAALVAAEAQRGGCHAVIMNTVRDAQALYRQLQRCLPDDVELMLIHARFPHAWRQRLEDDLITRFGKEARNRPVRAVVIGSQIMESSLDIDFDQLYTQLCPIDLLLQRAGRLHRHRRSNPPTGRQPVVHLFTPPTDRYQFGRTGSVYSPHVLIRTLSALSGETALAVPARMRELIGRVYDGLPLPAEPDLEEALAASTRFNRSQADERQKAERYLIPAPSPNAFDLPRRGDLVHGEAQEGISSYFHAKTRLGDETIRVLLLRDGEPALERLLSATKRPPAGEAQTLVQWGVNIPKHWVRDVTPQPGYHLPAEAPPWLPGYLVLRLQADRWSGADAKGRPVTICLDEDLGVFRLEDGEEE